MDFCLHLELLQLALGNQSNQSMWIQWEYSEYNMFKKRLVFDLLICQISRPREDSPEPILWQFTPLREVHYFFETSPNLNCFAFLIFPCQLNLGNNKCSSNVPLSVRLHVSNLFPVPSCSAEGLTIEIAGIARIAGRPLAECQRQHNEELDSTKQNKYHKHKPYFFNLEYTFFERNLLTTVTNMFSGGVYVPFVSMSNVLALNVVCQKPLPTAQCCVETVTLSLRTLLPVTLQCIPTPPTYQDNYIKIR